MLLSCFDHFLGARAEIQKYFRSFFGSNENLKICFRDLLTFTNNIKQNLRPKFDIFKFKLVHLLQSIGILKFYSGAKFGFYL